MIYNITKHNDGFLHRVEFTDDDGTREYSVVLPVENRVDKPKNPSKCFICGTAIRRNVCQVHNEEYHKPIASLRYFTLHGYTSVSANPVIREKANNTNLKRFGTLNVSSSDEIKNKKRQTTLNNHGVEYPMQSKNVQEKSKSTNVKNRGVEYPMQSEDVRKKTKSNSVKNHGYEFPNQSPEVRAKTEQTNIDRYGVKSTLSHLDTLRKIAATNLEKYGTENPINNPVISAKRNTTNLEKYGFSTPLSNIEVQKRTREGASMSFYGVPDIMVWRDDFVNIMKNKGITNALLAYPLISHQTAMRHFIPDDMKNKGSVIQDDVQKQLEQHTDLIFESNVRSIVPDNNALEIDLLNREHNISIEFNGLYWHRDKHQLDIDKTNAMRSIGYQHVVIDETDVWSNRLSKIAAMVNPNKTRLYARKCQIRTLDSKIVRPFMDQYHLQGNADAPLRYGLFYNDELIQVMTFGKPRYDRTYDYELIRLCTKRGYSVTGGAERLFKYFMKTYDNPTVISYCDFKYFSGDVYERLGMKYIRLNPFGYVWYRDGVVLKRYQTMKHKLSKLLENFDPDLSEAKNMEKHKYIKVPDLGQKVFSYK